MRRYPVLTHLPRAFAAAALLLGAPACNQPGGQESIAGGAPERRPASDHVSKLTGLSHLPVPASSQAFGASLRRHYPPAMRAAGRGGDVLVDVRLDETGRVRDVDVVKERRTVGNEHQVVALETVPGSNLEVQREVQLNYDPEAFGAAAESAVREVRFLPALREGKPVPYTLRMTVSFTPREQR